MDQTSKSASYVIDSLSNELQSLFLKGPPHIFPDEHEINTGELGKHST